MEYDKELKAWTNRVTDTCKFPIPIRGSLDSFEDAAATLSLLTGKKITFRHIIGGSPGNETIWGSFGWFAVENPNPLFEINRKATPTGVTCDYSQNQEDLQIHRFTKE